MIPGPKISGNPYIGPRTYRREQGRLFFGREREARDLSARVMSERLLLFYAQSGAGKSSLINTRLVPNLQKNGFAALPVARVSGDLPSNVAAVDNIFLFNLMTSLLDKNAGDPNRFAALSLKDFLAGLSSEDGKTFIYEPAGHDEPEAGQPATPMPYVLILDQFEEIVTAHPGRWQERTAFFSQLNQAILDDPNLWVLLTLREDYVAALDPYKPLMFNRMHATFFMERMGEAAALDAVRKPAELGGRPFAAGVAEKLVEDLLQVRVPGQETTIKGQYVEPVQLQVVCYQLWQTLTASAPLWRASDMGKQKVEITFEDLAMAGDVNQALERFYDDTIQDTLRELQEKSIATEIRERQLRSWFEDELITEARTRGLVRQGEDMAGTLPVDVVRVLQRRFLVRAEARSGDTWIELIHDRFIGPVRESNRKWILARADLEPWVTRAREWKQSGPEGRENPDLLFRDSDLDRALEATKGQHLAPEVKGFLDASAQAQKDRMLGEALSTTTRLRTQRISLIALSLVTLLALALAVWFYKQAKGEAEEKDVANQALIIKQGELKDAYSDLADKRNQVERAYTDLQVANLRANTLELIAGAKQASNPALAVLLARKALVNSLNLDPDRDLSLRIDAENTLNEALVKTYQPTELEALGDGLHSIAFSPNTKMIAAGGYYGVHIWDLQSGELIEGLSDNAYDVLGVAFNHDGDLLAAASRDGTAIVWDVDSRQRLLTLVGHSAGVVDVEFSPDGTHLATASFDGTARIWDVSNGDLLATLDGHSGEPLEAVAFSPNGRQLATVSHDRTAIVWDLTTLPEPRQLLTLAGHLDMVTHVAASPDGNYWATVSNDGTAILWSAGTGEQVRDFCCHDGWIDGVAFSPDSHLLATAGQDGAVRLWSIETSELLRTFTEHNDHVWDVAFSANGSLLASASEDGKVVARPIALEDLQDLWQPSDVVSIDTAFSEEGTHVAILEANGDGQSVELLMLEPFSLTRSIPIVTEVKGVLLDRNGGQLAYYNPSGEVWLCKPTLPCELVFDAGKNPQEQAQETGARNLDNRKEEDQPLTPIDMDVTFSGNDQNLIIAIPSQKRIIEVIPGGISKEVPLLGASENITFTHVVFGHQGVVSATVNVSGTVDLWNGTTPLHGFDRVQALENDIAFSPNDQLVAVALDAGHVSVSLVASDTRPIELSVANEDLPIVALVFDSTGNRLAVVKDNAVRVFDLRSQGKGVLTITSDRKITDVVFGDKGDQLVVAHADGALRRYRLGLGYLLDTACRLAPRNLTYDEWQSHRLNLGEINDPVTSMICADELDSSFVMQYLARGSDEVPLNENSIPPDSLFSALIELSSQVRRQNEPRMSETSNQALIYLRKAADLPVASTDAHRQQLAWAFGALCALSQSGSSDDAITAGCDDAVRLAQQLNNIDLNRSICSNARNDSVQATVIPACARAATLASSSTNIRAALAVCELSNISTLRDVVAPACSHAEALAVSLTDPYATLELCRDVIKRGFADEVLGICERAVEIGEITNDPWRLNIEMCRQTPPLAAPSLFAPACNRVAQLTPEIHMGSAVSATLSSAAGDFWLFEGKAGDVVDVRLIDIDYSNDPNLTIYALEDLNHPLNHNEDPGVSSVAIVNGLRLPDDGKYLLNARNTSGANGKYRLSLGIVENVPISDTIPISITDNFSRTINWQLASDGQEFVTVHLRGALSDSRPQLEVVSPSGRHLVGALSNDVGSDNASFEGILLSSSGNYHIQPRSNGNGGSYSLEIASVPIGSIVLDNNTVVDDPRQRIWQLNNEQDGFVSVAIETGDNRIENSVAVIDGAGQDVPSIDLVRNQQSAQLFALSSGQVYYFIVTSLVDAAPYTLTVSTVTPNVINIGDSRPSETNQNALWSFEAEEGQFVSITAESLGSNSDPYLQLFDQRGRQLYSDDDSGGDLNAQIKDYVLPGRGAYFVWVGDTDGSAGYTLSLTETQPETITIAKAVQSSTRQHSLWRYDGSAGEIVTITLSGASERFDPYLYMLDANGVELISNDDYGVGWSGYDSQIANYVLPTSGPYFIRTGRPDSMEPYTLTITAPNKLPISIGPPVSGSTTSNEVFTFSGNQGQIKRIDMTKELSSSTLDPRVTLIAEDGEMIGQDDDSGVGNNARLVVVLPRDGVYTILPGSYGSGDFRLSVVDAPVERLQMNNAQVLRSDRAFRLSGQTGQILTIDLTGANEFSYSSMQLVAANGVVLASSDAWSGPEIVLPQNGEYLILPQFVADGSEDTITASLTDAASASNLDETASRTLRNLAINNATDQALALYAWGTADGGVAFTADALNALCWHGAVYGALHGSADRVTTVCEELVDIADMTDPYYVTLRHDIRGVARALTGNIDGAIEDFEYFVDNGGDHASQRQEWIDRLRAGEPVTDVLDEATLRQLLLQ